MNKQLDWTHKDVKITDIRKVGELYILTVDNISSPLKVRMNIFERRLEPYFLKDPKTVTRKEIMEVTWNMYLTQGYYIKIVENDIIEHPRDNSKEWYVSYLEISGPLGSFKSILKQNYARNTTT